MEKIQNYIRNSRELIIELQTLLTAIPALGPENGGTGEYDKAHKLVEYLRPWNFDAIDIYNAPDERVPSGERPSVVATINGNNRQKNLWIITHTDIVPPGDLQLWDTNPYEAIVKGDRIYGRGTEDNQQGLVSALIAAKAFLEHKITPELTIKLLFVADEELGSDYGIQYLLDKTTLFNKEDLILTPDVGDPEGAYMEVSEKSILWLEFLITGKQSHGSRPNLGINAARVSSFLDVQLANMYQVFNKRDESFDLAYSTFEPTKRVGSIENFNTIPGSEILCYDCRILPEYKLEDILEYVTKTIRALESQTGASITMKIGQQIQAPPPTPVDAPVVQLLKNSIKKVLNKDAKTCGISGGTVAAYFRMRGYHATLWSTLDNSLHAPNEYSSITNCINDALVFAQMLKDAK